ncbi:hypothetical protein O181_116637 [Austropuccinia psidii MF-1]|uniref:Uncharacterized protein n=1 Tax=Austropuccinia psidii MF-1 TaxID=1389203 RepID=A0A9Q3PYL1_9BASI|nr:hypothetical protein [Austropuccinia psidii MF-1]
MASSGHFDPSQIYDGYRAVEILDPACTECLAKGKDCFQHYNPQSSKCHYCFIGKKPCRRTGPLANRLQSQLIPSTPRTFQPVLASIPTTIPPASPSTSHSRPALNPEVRPSPSQKPRNPPITTSQQL